MCARGVCLVNRVIGIFWKELQAVTVRVVEEGQQSQPSLRSKIDHVKDEEVVMLLCQQKDKPASTVHSFVSLPCILTKQTVVCQYPQAL